ncbi:hypothetical protein F6476_13065 [Pseudomonas umsongensis]|uniref:hypothetical protein n=1 Tax=Pseudomonas umsongensis TaxID=198618 RepID=UPI001246A2A5|nr:hypothetical protein [Pseudomonas umsongensis]QFG30061.1 hypothetical protein F6476_13065 [Pseudomonas umsongensis]
MSKVEMQTAVFFTEHEFTCWRERECNDVYPCQVSSQGSNGVTLRLDDTTIRFAKGVAQEVARCLKDAFLVNFGNTVNVLFTSGKRESKLERVFRKDVAGRWHYKANGRFKCRQTESEIYFSKITKVPGDPMEEIGIYTVEDGGVELVFGYIGYSFSMLDASWLAENLMKANQV